MLRWLRANGLSDDHFCKDLSAAGFAGPPLPFGKVTLEVFEGVGVATARHFPEMRSGTFHCSDVQDKQLFKAEAVEAGASGDLGSRHQ